MKIKIATMQLITKEITGENEKQHLQNIIDNYNQGENPTEEQIQIAMNLIEKLTNTKIYTDEFYDAGTQVIHAAFTENDEIIFEI